MCVYSAEHQNPDLFNVDNSLSRLGITNEYRGLRMIGTSLASLAAALGENNFCSVGVAPAATIALLELEFYRSSGIETLLELFFANSEAIDVYLHTFTFNSNHTSIDLFELPVCS